MKKRGVISIAIGGLLALMVFAPCAMAGTQQDPEITDLEGDAAMPESQRCDILSVWFWGETETSFNITIQLKSLSDMFEMTNTFFCRVYFHFNGCSYNTDCQMSENSILPFHTYYMWVDSNKQISIPINGTFNFENSTITWIVPIDLISGFGPGKTLRETHADAWMNIDTFVPVIYYSLHVGFVPGDYAPGGNSVEETIQGVAGEVKYGKDYTYLPTNMTTNETSSAVETKQAKEDLKTQENVDVKSVPGFGAAAIFACISTALLRKKTNSVPIFSSFSTLLPSKLN